MMSHALGCLTTGGRERQKKPRRSWASWHLRTTGQREDATEDTALRNIGTFGIFGTFVIFGQRGIEVTER